MRNININYLGFIMILCLLPTKKVDGQFSDAGALLGAGAEDAKTLTKSYISPYFHSIGANLSSGWYNTAKPHKIGGFDLTFAINAGIIPKDDREFNIDELDLNNLYRADGTGANSPTIAGKNDEGPLMKYRLESDAGDIEGDAFKMPPGLGVPVTPSPMLQLGIGLIKNTEVIVRYVPNMTFGKTTVGLWGIGGKHDIKQWIPAMEKLPVFHLSVVAGFTKFTAGNELSITPASIGLNDSYASGTWDGQKLDMEIKSFTASALFSFDLPIITFYGGLGLVTTNSTIAFKGDYPIAEVNESSGEIEASLIKDPLKINIRNDNGGVTSPRLNAGMRLKFAIVTMHFDYIYAKYSVFSFGLGISVR